MEFSDRAAFLAVTWVDLGKVLRRTLSIVGCLEFILAAELLDSSSACAAAWVPLGARAFWSPRTTPSFPGSPTSRRAPPRFTLFETSLILPVNMNATPKVVSLGEVLWDLLPSGPVLGGAPSNFACHVAGLGGDAALVSRVGDDDFGRKARRQLTAKGVRLDALGTDPTAPTGTVGVELTADGQPKFTIHENVAWDRITADDAARAVVGAADAVCFGSLAQRTPAARLAIRALLGSTRPGALRIFDINLRAPFYAQETLAESLRLADVLKLNDGELAILAQMFALPGSPREQVQSLARTFELQAILLTLGAEGSCLWRAEQWYEQPGQRVDVRDTIGAGDSFTAVYEIGRAHV